MMMPSMLPLDRCRERNDPADLARFRASLTEDLPPVDLRISHENVNNEPLYDIKVYNILYLENFAIQI